MGYKCANDLFNYCSGEPEWDEPPKELGLGRYLGGGHCRLDPKTCGKHQTISQQLEGVVLPKDSYHHTQTAKVKPRKKKK